jgi:hypothetical protein
MLAMIESGNQKETHPAYWAPFIVVGEGGRTGAIGLQAVGPWAPVVVAPPSAKKAAKTSRERHGQGRFGDNGATEG